ncbi:Glutathione S-transferase T3 [Cardamine amara subsp. amara]|uniref:Glutathione S-transferase T3 n=1 Tax=Cardamine amara subsp. amara TaxID=228776 RepID=A0ABD0ZNK0_CARAN
MNPFHQPPYFVDLLNSQQEPSGSSQVPIFSTQFSEAPFYGGDTLGGTPGDTSAERKERNKWSPTDDIVLISAWLNTSKDPVVGNEQKSGAFWKRIVDYVAKSDKVDRSVVREPSHCKNRWQKVNDIVQKFCGSYAAATREKASGQNEDDVLKRAYEIYYNDHNKKKFTLAHAWRELRYDQKWCDLSLAKTDATCKKRKGEDDSYISTFVADDPANTRPPGVKAAKGKGKKRVDEGKDVVELQTIWEIKEKDNANKLTLSNRRILENLIAKKDPLSPTEQALKEKLISDMLAN